VSSSATRTTSRSEKHVQIQLDVGRPLVAPEQISFPNGL
jgi:hypothetical protein